MSASRLDHTRMSTEIAEQPDAIARTLEALLPRAAELRALATGLRHVSFVARGSSDNAAVYGRYLCELHAGRPAALAAPSVATRYRRALDLSDTLVVGISQSGHTEEIVDAMAWARRCGARTVGVTNLAGSPLERTVDLALVTQAGDERAVPATKTYTTQLVAMAVLGVAIGPEEDPLAAQLSRVPGEVRRLVESAAQLADAAQRVAGRTRVVVSGRGYTLSTALELSLKLLETCQLPSLGLSYADLLHGPIALVDDDTAAIVVAPPDGPLVEPLTDLAGRLAARGAAVVGLGGDERFARACTTALGTTDLPEALSPLALVVPGQLLVEHLARQLGRDPDAPRGLRKVTQTDPRGDSPGAS